MSSVRAALAIRSKENCHPFERLGLSVRKNCHPFERLGLSVRKNRHPFERLDELSVKNNCQPRYCSKPLLLLKPFATNLSKNVTSSNSSKRCLPSPLAWVASVSVWFRSLLLNRTETLATQATSPHKFSRYIFC